MHECLKWFKNIGTYLTKGSKIYWKVFLSIKQLKYIPEQVLKTMFSIKHIFEYKLKWV